MQQLETIEITRRDHKSQSQTWPLIRLQSIKGQLSAQNLPAINKSPVCNSSNSKEAAKSPVRRQTPGPRAQQKKSKKKANTKKTKKNNPADSLNSHPKEKKEQVSSTRAVREVRGILSYNCQISI